MADFTHTININHTGGGKSTQRTVTKLADAEDNRSIIVTDGATDFSIGLVIDLSALKMLMMVCDQDVTVETNDGGSPDDTFLLKSGEPLLWWEGSTYTNPITVDVATNIFVTHVASGTDPVLDISVLQDATP